MKRQLGGGGGGVGGCKQLPGMLGESEEDEDERPRESTW